MDALDFDLIPIPIERKVAADAWKAPADFKLISADDHNLEMDHLFEERLPAAFQARAPRFWRDPGTNELHADVGDRSFAPPGIGNIGHALPGCWDVTARLKDMDAEGIYGSVLYHGQFQALNAIFGEDPELYTACVHVYNEWLAEFTAPARDRLVGVAILPSFLKPETARDEVQKIIGLGYKTLQMPSYPRGVRYNSREMDPVWQAVVDSGLPLSFHVSAFQEFHGNGSLGANVHRNMSPFRPLLGQLVFSGVFDRFPDLKVVFAEGGIAWAADAVASMDRIFRSYYTILKPKLEHMPSHYWYKNCLATFMDDPVGIQTMNWIGVDNAMWSIDYPHPESCYGYASDVAKSVYDALGHDDAKKVLGGNAVKIYGF